MCNVKKKETTECPRKKEKTEKNLAENAGPKSKQTDQLRTCNVP